MTTFTITAADVESARAARLQLIDLGEEKAAALLAWSTTVQPNTAASERCAYCDNTGDVHTPTGEWRGECTACKADAPSVALNSDQRYWVKIRTKVIDALEAEGLRIVSIGDRVVLSHVVKADAPVTEPVARTTVTTGAGGSRRHNYVRLRDLPDGTHNLYTHAPAIEELRPVGYCVFGVKEDVALLDYAGHSVEAVRGKVQDLAYREGFRGRTEDRMQQLGWAIRPLYGAAMAQGDL